MSVLSDISKLAGVLDQKGLTAEADALDAILASWKDMAPSVLEDFRSSEDLSDELMAMTISLGEPLRDAGLAFMDMLKHNSEFEDYDTSWMDNPQFYIEANTPPREELSEADDDFLFNGKVSEGIKELIDLAESGGLDELSEKITAIEESTNELRGEIKDLSDEHNGETLEAMLRFKDSLARLFEMLDDTAQLAGRYDNSASEAQAGLDKLNDAQPVEEEGDYSPQDVFEKSLELPGSDSIGNSIERMQRKNPDLNLGDLWSDREAQSDLGNSIKTPKAPVAMNPRLSELFSS